jgi:N-acylneuraminate cytidylyltransferase
VLPTDIQNGLQILKDSGADYVFSVTSYAYPVQRAIRINQDQQIEMFHPEHLNTRSQDLEEACHDAGQFYWGKAGNWLKKQPLFGSNVVPVSLPRHRVQDTDTVDDWLRAELMFKCLNDKVKEN